MNVEHRAIQVNITTNTIFKLLFTVAGVFVLFKIKGVLFLILVSIVIATFVDAVAHKLKRIGMPRLLSVILVFVFLILGLSAIIYAVVPTLFSELSHAVTQIAKYVPQENLQAIIDPNAFSSIDKFISTIGTEAPASQFASTTQALLSSASGAFYGTVQALFGSLTNFLLIIVISFYLSVQEKGIESFIRLVTPIKYEGYVIGLWNRSARKIARWIRGQMFSALIMSILTFIALYFLNVPYALLLSLIALVCGLIPFGMIFATIPAVLAGFSGGGFQLGLVVLLVYFLLQQLEGYVFIPLINQRTTGISPLMVILSLLIGGQLAGFWGLVLAMPVALFLLELMNDHEDRKASLRGEILE